MQLFGNALHLGFDASKVIRRDFAAVGQVDVVCWCTTVAAHVCQLRSLDERDASPTVVGAADYPGTGERAMSRLVPIGLAFVRLRKSRDFTREGVTSVAVRKVLSQQAQALPEQMIAARELAFD